MDIASVYLNFASLLGTEIEVEGYYHRGVIIPDENDRGTAELIIFLPGYIFTKVLSIKSDNFFIRFGIKISIKGTLRQNQHGDPFLDEISSISCLREHGFYHATLTHQGNLIACRLHAHIIFSKDMPLERYQSIKSMTSSSSIISKQIALEGYLEGPTKGFRLNTPYLVSNLFDFLRYKVSHATNFPKTYYKPVFVPSDLDAENYLKNRFGTRYSELGPRLGGAIFTIYGQIELFTPRDSKILALKKPSALKFVSIDYMTIHKEIIFEPAKEVEILREMGLLQ